MCEPADQTTTTSDATMGAGCDVAADGEKDMRDDATGSGETGAREGAADANPELPTATLPGRGGAGGATAGTGEDADATEPLEPTAVRPQVEASGTASRPQVHVGRGGRRGTGGARGFLARHKVALVVAALVVVALVAGGVVLAAWATSLPDEDAVRADARTLVEAPEVEAGSYGSDDTLVVRSVTVRSVARAQALSDGGTVDGATGYATAEVLVSFVGSAVGAEVVATLDYALVGGEWEATGTATSDSVAWSATDGVSTDAVLANASVVLARAERTLDDDADEPSLAEIYVDADEVVTQVTVASETFDEDAQTDVVVLAFASSGSWSSYSCEVTVTFGFVAASGQWEISAIEVSDGAKEPAYAFVGTWSGSFRSQSTVGTKCLAAQNEGLVVVVTGASEDSGTMTLTGTVSGVAHLHAYPDASASGCDGDLVLDAVSFTATLASEGADGSLTFEAELPEQVDGTVTLELEFDGSTGAVTATLTTSWSRTTTILFIPYTESADYADTYSLTLVEDAE